MDYLEYDIRKMTNNPQLFAHLFKCLRRPMETAANPRWTEQDSQARSTIWVWVALQMDWSKVVQSLAKDRSFRHYVNNQLMNKDVYYWLKTTGVGQPGGGSSTPYEGEGNKPFRTDIDVTQLGRR